MSRRGAVALVFAAVVLAAATVSYRLWPRPFKNTLGMKSVPVPGTDVLFCIHETRVRDYTAFAAAKPGLDGVWRNPKFQETDVTPGKPRNSDGSQGRRPAHRNNERNFLRWRSKQGGEGGEPLDLRPHGRNQFGSTTVSMTWMTPLLAATSVFTTLALSTVTAPSATLMSSAWPLTVLAFMVFTSAAMTLPGTTW